MLKNSLPNELCPGELLLRSVPSTPNFWKEDRISSAAFKKKEGVSVDRTYDRSLEDSIAFMLQHLSGSVVSLTQDDCRHADVYVFYCPEYIDKDTKTIFNIYHCEIHRSKEIIPLHKHQARELASRAKIEYRVSISPT